MESENDGTASTRGVRHPVRVTAASSASGEQATWNVRQTFTRQSCSMWLVIDDEQRVRVTSWAHRSAARGESRVPSGASARRGCSWRALARMVTWPRLIRPGQRRPALFARHGQWCCHHEYRRHGCTARFRRHVGVLVIEQATGSPSLRLMCLWYCRCPACSGDFRGHTNPRVCAALSDPSEFSARPREAVGCGCVDGRMEELSSTRRLITVVRPCPAAETVRITSACGYAARSEQLHG
jgi:hypothetical protein